MTVLDLTGQMDIHRLSGDHDHVVVRLPLAVPAETFRHEPMMREFMSLARTKDLPAEVRNFPEGTFLTVTVPLAASREETAELLDGALRLIDEALTLANARDSASAATEQYIRDWWDSRKQSPQGDAASD